MSLARGALEAVNRKAHIHERLGRVLSDEVRAVLAKARGENI